MPMRMHVVPILALSVFAGTWIRAWAVSDRDKASPQPEPPSTGLSLLGQSGAQPASGTRTPSAQSSPSQANSTKAKAEPKAPERIEIEKGHAGGVVVYRNLNATKILTRPVWSVSHKIPPEVLRRFRWHHGEHWSGVHWKRVSGWYWGWDPAEADPKPGYGDPDNPPDGRDRSAQSHTSGQMLQSLLGIEEILYQHPDRRNLVGGAAELLRWVNSQIKSGLDIPNVFPWDDSYDHVAAGNQVDGVLKELGKDPPAVREALAALKKLIDWFYAIDPSKKVPKPPAMDSSDDPPHRRVPDPPASSGRRKSSTRTEDDRPNVIPMPPARPFPLPGGPNIIPTPTFPNPNQER
jgi:hypothetical protein